MTNKLTCLTQKWAEGKLSLKGGVEVANAYIASISIYHVTLVLDGIGVYSFYCLVEGTRSNGQQVGLLPTSFAWQLRNSGCTI